MTTRRRRSRRCIWFAVRYFPSRVSHRREGAPSWGASSCRTRSRSAGVSTPAEACAVGTTRMPMPLTAPAAAPATRASRAGQGGGRLTSAGHRADIHKDQYERHCRPSAIGRNRARGRPGRSRPSRRSSVSQFARRASGRQRVLISSAGVGQHRGDRRIDGLGFNQGLVALDVDHQPAGQLARRPRQCGRCRSRGRDAS